jgi:hypothetical protein
VNSAVAALGVILPSLLAVLVDGRLTRALLRDVRAQMVTLYERHDNHVTDYDAHFGRPRR